MIASQDVLNEILSHLALKDFVRFNQVNKAYHANQINKSYHINQSNKSYRVNYAWEKYYQEYDMDLKKIFPHLSYKKLVQILYKVDCIVEKANVENVYLHLKEPIIDAPLVIMKSNLCPLYIPNSFYDIIYQSSIIAIQLNQITHPNIHIDLFTKLGQSITYRGNLYHIKLFLSYLVYYGH